MDNGTWRKSTYSGTNGGSCVEVGTDATGVTVRDTTDRDGGTFQFSGTAWARFTADLK